ncbi:hypothetical protein WJX81_006901 [Elliptochloris bilobata]|uniref:USP domain-containing protein n=1 Tax=Elliptochloris bilobata TaxID=381761 RepID=A0AAW1RA08_9CHLO
MEVRAPHVVRPQALAAAAPGLQNEAGEYNCFLNMVVQCLWHCAAFREDFQGLGPDRLQRNAVTAGLAALFKSFAKMTAAETAGEQPRQVVAPTALREALAELNAQRFNIAEMSDAAEVMGAIYDSVRTMPGGGKLVDTVFGLHVAEHVHCARCGKDTHANAHTQFFYNVSATALRMQGGSSTDVPPLGKLLHSIEARLCKSCDTDVGGCGAQNEIVVRLTRAPPAVFTVQLAWESQQESAADITATLAAVQDRVDLGAVYSGLGRQEYRLRSMVCFYGAHYHAFVCSSNRWLTFDDSAVNAVGPEWRTVIKKCGLGRIQPAVLLFEKVPGVEASSALCAAYYVEVVTLVGEQRARSRLARLSEALKHVEAWSDPRDDLPAESGAKDDERLPCPLELRALAAPKALLLESAWMRCNLLRQDLPGSWNAQETPWNLRLAFNKLLATDSAGAGFALPPSILSRLQRQLQQLKPSADKEEQGTKRRMTAEQAAQEEALKKRKEKLQELSKKRAATVKQPEELVVCDDQQLREYLREAVPDGIEERAAWFRDLLQLTVAEVEAALPAVFSGKRSKELKFARKALRFWTAMPNRALCHALPLLDQEYGDVDSAELEALTPSVALLRLQDLLVMRLQVQMAEVDDRGQTAAREVASGRSECAAALRLACGGAEPLPMLPRGAEGPREPHFEGQRVVEPWEELDGDGAAVYGEDVQRSGADYIVAASKHVARCLEVLEEECMALAKTRDSCKSDADLQPRLLETTFWHAHFGVASASIYITEKLPGELRLADVPADCELAALRGEALLALAHLVWRREAHAAGVVGTHVSDAGAEERIQELVGHLAENNSAWERTAVLGKKSHLRRFRFRFLDTSISSSLAAAGGGHVQAAASANGSAPPVVSDQAASDVGTAPPFIFIAPGLEVQERAERKILLDEAPWHGKRRMEREGEVLIECVGAADEAPADYAAAAFKLLSDITYGRSLASIGRPPADSVPGFWERLPSMIMMCAAQARQYEDVRRRAGNALSATLRALEELERTSDDEGARAAVKEIFDDAEHFWSKIICMVDVARSAAGVTMSEYMTKRREMREREIGVLKNLDLPDGQARIAELDQQCKAVARRRAVFHRDFKAAVQERPNLTAQEDGGGREKGVILVLQRAILGCDLVLEAAYLSTRHLQSMYLRASLLTIPAYLDAAIEAAVRARVSTRQQARAEVAAEKLQQQLLEAEEADQERSRAKRRAEIEKKAAKERRAAERRAEEAAKKAAEEAERERRQAEKAQREREAEEEEQRAALEAAAEQEARVAALRAELLETSKLAAVPAPAPAGVHMQTAAVREESTDLAAPAAAHPVAPAREARFGRNFGAATAAVTADLERGGQAPRRGVRRDAPAQQQEAPRIEGHGWSARSGEEERGRRDKRRSMESLPSGVLSPDLLDLPKVGDLVRICHKYAGGSGAPSAEVQERMLREGQAQLLRLRGALTSAAGGVGCLRCGDGTHSWTECPDVVALPKSDGPNSRKAYAKELGVEVCFYCGSTSHWFHSCSESQGFSREGARVVAEAFRNGAYAGAPALPLLAMMRAAHRYRGEAAPADARRNSWASRCGQGQRASALAAPEAPPAAGAQKEAAASGGSVAARNSGSRPSSGAAAAASRPTSAAAAETGGSTGDGETTRRPPKPLTEKELLRQKVELARSSVAQANKCLRCQNAGHSLMDCPQMMGVPPGVRARMKDMYLRGERAAADALLESGRARDRPARTRAVLPALPAGIRLTTPPHVHGCFQCGQRHGLKDCPELNSLPANTLQLLMSYYRAREEEKMGIMKPSGSANVITAVRPSRRTCHHCQGDHRVRECGELEDVSEQGKGWMSDLYTAGKREAALTLMRAEKAQRAGGCLHCRGPHRLADCDALGRLAKRVDLTTLYRQGRVAEAANALGNAGLLLGCAACRSIGAADAHRHSMEDCPRLAALPEEACTQMHAALRSGLAAEVDTVRDLWGLNAALQPSGSVAAFKGERATSPAASAPGRSPGGWAAIVAGGESAPAPAPKPAGPPTVDEPPPAILREEPSGAGEPGVHAPRENSHEAVAEGAGSAVRAWQPVLPPQAAASASASAESRGSRLGLPPGFDSQPPQAPEPAAGAPAAAYKLRPAPAPFLPQLRLQGEAGEAAPAPAAVPEEPDDEDDMAAMLSMLSMGQAAAPKAAAPQAAAPQAWDAPGALAAAPRAAPVGSYARAAAGEISAVGGESDETDGTAAAQEAADMEAAIKASIAEMQARPQKRHPLGMAPQPPQRATDTERDAAAAAPSETGLQNETGEYNCFLNAVVQCLWHCAAFKDGLLRRPEDALQGNAVTAGLLELFRAFAAQDAERGRPDGRRLVVDPTPLREALAAYNAAAFRIGEMSDAAEVLGEIYDSLRAVQGGGELVDAVFGLHVSEHVHCGACGKDTHVNAYTQFFYNASATALRLQAMVEEAGAPTLGQLLRGLEQQHQKKCDVDAGGCDAPSAVQHFLQLRGRRPPAVFTLQLAWESQREGPEDIRDTLAAISEEVDIGQVYLGLEEMEFEYSLHSMVCFYGAHYQAFVWSQKAQLWLLFDDSHVSKVGDFEAVSRKCFLGRIQPSVLFFTRMGPV